MARKFLLALLGGVAALFVTPAFAVNDWNNDASFGSTAQPPVTTNWATTARWSAGAVPAGGQGDINITNVFLQATTITNASNAGSINFLRIWSGFGKALTASSNVTVITSAGGLF